MMSRITLHLRRQALSPEEDDPESDYTTMPLTDLRTRLRFTHSNAPGGSHSHSHSRSRSGQTAPTVSVTVEETSVVHDDRGNLLRSPTDEVHVAEPRKAAEWYEMAVRRPRRGSNPPPAHPPGHPLAPLAERPSSDVALEIC